MRRTLGIAFLLLFAAQAYSQPVSIPVLNARNGVMVLAKTIEVLDAQPGEATLGDSRPAEVREWKLIVLERIDTFAGSVPKRFKVAVPAGEVKLSNYFAHPPSGGGGYAGRGPMNGLQPGDVSVWGLEAPGQDGAYPIHSFNVFAYEQEPQIPSATPAVFTAPGSDFALPEYGHDVLLAEGTDVMHGSNGKLPEYNHSLPPALRYADLVASLAVRDLASNTDRTQRHAVEMLCQLPDQLKGTAGLAPAVPSKTLDSWFQTRVIDRWPGDEKAKLNLLLTRLYWKQSDAEPEFLKQLKTVGRKALLYYVPPISDPTYYVECCESDEPYPPCDGFRYMRDKKSTDKRVLKAAILWLDRVTLGSQAADVMRDVRGCGLIGDILWYLADTSGDRSLIEHWTEPTQQEMLRAKEVAEKLLAGKS